MGITERGTRKQVIMAELPESDAAAFWEICKRKQRTTGFVAGEILRAWLHESREPQRADSIASGHQCTAPEK
jgi:hypothetical protein